MKLLFLNRSALHGPRTTFSFVARGPWSVVLLLAMCFWLSATGFSDQDSPSQKREQTQYERRLQMLGTRYSRAPAGTVEFPQELMAVDYINEGYKLFQKNQYDLALEAANQALKYDPKSPVAHELAGDVFYLKQDLAGADEHYRLAFQYEPIARIKDKLLKLTKETVNEKNLNTVEEVHFLIKYDRNQSEYEGFELRTLLNDTYLGVARDLGHYLNHKTTVLFYDPKHFQQIGDLPHWVGGLFDGKVRLPVNPRQLGEKQLRAVTRHEVAHVFIDDISHKRAPIWLHEGFAVFQENKVTPVSARALRVLADPQKVLPFADLFNPAIYERNKNNQAWMNLFYMQSYDFIDYIIGRYGIFYVKQLALAFGENKNVEQVIQDVFKVSIDKMEKEWKASLATSFR